MHYLIEPYNPYEPDPRKKKKHWMQIAEEEALFHQMQEAEAKRAILEALSSKTLPPNSPNIASPTVGPTVNAASGAGGRPQTQFFAPRDSTVAFAASPSTSGSAPFTVQFINNSSLDAGQYDTWTWNFGDGTSEGSKTPVHVYQTGSFLVSLTGSSPGGVTSFATQIAISASLPVSAPAFTPTQTTGSTNSGSQAFSVAFTNTTPVIGAGPNTYLWIMSGSTAPVTPVTTSVLTNPTFTFQNTGSYFITLQASGSYAVKNLITLNAVSAIT
jgi:hypothetical protein